MPEDVRATIQEMRATGEAKTEAASHAPFWPPRLERIGILEENVGRVWDAIDLILDRIEELERRGQ